MLVYAIESGYEKLVSILLVVAGKVFRIAPHAIQEVCRCISSARCPVDSSGCRDQDYETTQATAINRELHVRE